MSTADADSRAIYAHIHANQTPFSRLLVVPGSWEPVLRLLGGKYRTVRFDGRARGKPGKSADYSGSSSRARRRSST